MFFPIEPSFDWVLVPFVLQGALMAVDEFHHHRKRGLPDWERLGHPLDTLTVLVPFLFIRLASPASPLALGVFGFAALFSCLFVTKDEGVHLRHSTPGEQRVHALLFMLHPLLFLAMAATWLPLHGFSGAPMRERTEFFWSAQALLMTGFLAWQLFGWKSHEVLRNVRANRSRR